MHDSNTVNQSTHFNTGRNSQLSKKALVMKTQRILLWIGLMLITAILAPARSQAIELLAARNETGADRAFQAIAVEDSRKMTIDAEFEVGLLEGSHRSIDLASPKPVDWVLQESHLLQSELHAEEEKSSAEVALGVLRGEAGVEPSTIITDAATESPISPEYFAAFLLVIGLLVGSRLGIWRVMNQCCFVMAARAQGMSVSTKGRSHRHHRRRVRSQRNRRASWYFRSRPSRRRTRSHSSSRSGGRHRQSSWRPQNSRPSYRRGGSTGEYVVSDVVFTTNGPVARPNQRVVTPPLITLQ